MPVKAHGALPARSVNAILNSLRDSLPDVDNDYQLCKHMGWTTSKLSNWRSSRSKPSDKECAEIAEALGIPREFVIAVAHFEREKDPGLRDVWEHWARMVELQATGRAPEPPTRRRRATSRKAGIAALAAVGLGAVSGMHSTPAPAAQSATYIDIHYAHRDSWCELDATGRRVRC